MKRNLSDKWNSADYVLRWQRTIEFRRPERHLYFTMAVDLIQILGYSKFHFLELAAGYGAFSAYILANFPEATGLLCDISPQMMKLCKEFLSRYDGRYTYVLIDLLRPASISSLEREFQIVISTTAIHDFPQKRRQEIYREILNKLLPGGLFLNIDLTGVPREWLLEAYDKLRRREWNRAKQSIEAAGLTLEELYPTEKPRHGKIRQHGLISPLEKELDLMRQAGFTEVECIAKHLRTAFIAARKH